MDIKAVVDELVEVVKKDVVTILICSLIALVVSGLTLGILHGVAFTGLGLVFLKLKKDEKVDYKDIFAYINKFLNLFILTLLIGILTGIGLILLIIPGILILTIFIYAPFYLAYEEKGIIESMKLSYKTVVNNNLLMHVLILIILVAINAAVAGMGLVGTIITYPILVGFWVLLFEKIKIKA